MALESQNISLSLNKGIDTKSDPKQVVPGKLLTLENATFEKTSALKKRNGYVKKATALGTGNAIASFQSELVAMDGSSVYSYNDNFNTMSNKGKKVAVDLSTLSIVKNTYNQTQPDSAFSGNLSCYAWNDSSGGVYYSVFDKNTAHAIVSNSLIATTAANPKVLSLGGYFFIFYVDSSTSLKFFSINQTTLATSTVTIATILAANTYYDAQVINTRIFIAYSDISSLTSIKYTDSTLAVSSVYQQAVASTQKCIFGDSSNNVTVAYNSGTGASFFKSNYANTTQVIAPTVIETIADIQNICGIYSGTTAYFYYEVLNSTDNVSDNFIRKNTYASGVVGTASDYIRSLGLYSKPFIYSSSIYIVAAHESTLQSTYFVLDSTGSVVCKIAQFNGGGLSSIGLLAECTQVSSGIFSFAYLYKDFVQSVNGDVYTQTGVNSGTLTFASVISSSAIGNNLNISGGIVSMYDGQNVVEKGFNIYPEDLSYVQFNNGGGMGSGAYQYKAVYQWTDSQGQIHRSAPSIALTVNTDEQNKIYIPGSVSASRFTPTSGLDYRFFGPGMKITGPGISGDTYIIYGGGAYGDLSASTSANSGTYTLTPGRAWQLSSTIGSNVYTIRRQDIEYFQANFTSGSFTATMNYDANLRVGSKAALQLAGGASWFPTVLSYSNRVITFDIAAPLTGDGLIFQSLLLFDGTITSGSPTVTAVTDTTGILIGDKARSVPGFPAGTITVISKTANTITFNTNAISNTIANQAILQDARYPNLNESIFCATGSVWGGVATVTKVNTDGTIELSEQATVTSSKFDIISSVGAATNITIPTLRVTDKQGAVRDAEIALYRTSLNQNTFYRVNVATNPIINDPTVDYVEYFDTTLDNTLIGNEQLYTTGDVLENIQPPPTSVFGTFKNRLLLIPNENKNSLWYSKQISPNIVPEFSDEFIIDFPEVGGDLTAMAQLDEKLVVFKKNNIFYMVGDGPSANGLNNDFSQPILLPTDTGCIDAKSVILTPSGLMYQSTKGIYLLDRSLAVQYIGADVEAYNGYSVTSAKLIEGYNQVRFTMSNGVCLVFDYLFQQWGVFTPIAAVDATIFNSLYTYIKSDGTVYQESIGTYTDDGAFIQIKLTTSWFSFAGLQAFQRARKMLILGEYKSPHSLQINVAYDFETSYTQTVTIPVSSAPAGQYQYRLDFNRQKCEAIQVNISEQQSMPFGEGLTLSSMGLEIGAKKGLNKLSSTKSYG